ncbi:MAG TPA: hypothetical protein PK080_14290 [Hyphomonadaceae bacterium]|nr:hypothetical protein [Hyphomonadaceae bacterium]
MDVAERDLTAAGIRYAADIGAAAALQIVDDEAGVPGLGERGDGFEFLNREMARVDAERAFVAEKLRAFLERHCAARPFIAANARGLIITNAPNMAE